MVVADLTSTRMPSIDSQEKDSATGSVTLTEAGSASSLARSVTTVKAVRVESCDSFWYSLTVPLTRTVSPTLAALTPGLVVL